MSLVILASENGGEVKHMVNKSGLTTPGCHRLLGHRLKRMRIGTARWGHWDQGEGNNQPANGAGEREEGEPMKGKGRGKAWKKEGVGRGLYSLDHGDVTAIGAARGQVKPEPGGRQTATGQAAPSGGKMEAGITTSTHYGYRIFPNWHTSYLCGLEPFPDTADHVAWEVEDFLIAYWLELQNDMKQVLYTLSTDIYQIDKKSKDLVLQQFLIDEDDILRCDDH
ncbi:conserved hypothetical protein [Histoplasma capsulatum var. duboisii H88]|uniref:Uncharacterized protein n=1 Tax=Ajellomyces capsulatus (strain H88) TaxID=544711 RepID=F0UIA0_AJEC8|nr:conserved hypothetical protein [Histoplasma capsulatum var. duboisii H88]